MGSASRTVRALPCVSDATGAGCDTAGNCEGGAAVGDTAVAAGCRGGAGFAAAAGVCAVLPSASAPGAGEGEGAEPGPVLSLAGVELPAAWRGSVDWIDASSSCTGTAQAPVSGKAGAALVKACILARGAELKTHGPAKASVLCKLPLRVGQKTRTQCAREMSACPRSARCNMRCRRVAPA